MHGKLKLAGIGGDGCDDVTVVARVNCESDGCYDVQVLGGCGDDKVALGFQDDSLCKRETPSVSASFLKSAPKKSRNSFLLDGGPGCDKYDFEGNVEICPRNVEKLCEELLPPFCEVLIDI